MPSCRSRPHTDPLTKLHNRLRLNEDLDLLHSRSERYEREYSVALCDVDFFKAYNDNYGHQAGDAALRAVADTLVRNTRHGDGVYRYGGEEFLLLLPEQSARVAVAALERFRAAVETLGVGHPTVPDGVLTCSVGFSTFAPGCPVSSEELVKQADDALYVAKPTGRNVVVQSPQAVSAVSDASR